MGNSNGIGNLIQHTHMYYIKQKHFRGTSLSTLSKTKCVEFTAYLDQHSPAEPSLHQRLGHPACGISSRAVHLGVILPREGPTAMGSPASISVNNDFTPRQAGIPLE